MTVQEFRKLYNIPDDIKCLNCKFFEWQEIRYVQPFTGKDLGSRKRVIRCANPELMMTYSYDEGGELLPLSEFLCAQFEPLEKETNAKNI